LTALAAAAADVSVAGERMHGRGLQGAVAAFAERVAGLTRVGVVATPALQTVVATAGALAAGCAVVPLNPAAGERERAHVLADSEPDVVVRATDVDLTARAAWPAAEIGLDATALIVYTSGTTGAPKGAALSRRAVVACLDGLASMWQWGATDALAHALPMFHVHGLVLGTLGPLRLGSRLVCTPRLQPVDDATMFFAVPTMWSRLDDDALALMAQARLLVSGSAALPAPVFDRVRRIAAQDLVERYGLTESLIVTAASPHEERSPGVVGRPLPQVELRIGAADDTGLGEIQLRGATLFDGYLNRPDATAAAYTDDGWFRTGDLGRYDRMTGLRVLGRLATDLIKTGGYKVGAGEVEDALLAHPAVAEAAVIGTPDDDLGERITAFVVLHEVVTEQALIDHVATLLAPHKRPRDVRVVDALPRNAMGKLQKNRLVVE
jgi:fatty acid CoA ligase FadD36/malonyl-CoA/methylmalonyl-CoA synthetase